MHSTKIFLILFLVAPFFTSAQRGSGRKRAQEKKAYETNLKYYNEIFGANDKDFNIVEAPQEWKKEPIVMLCQKTHISFLRDTGTDGSQTKGVIRKRVIIQDKAAIENFSEFYYQKSSAFGIQHIKPDGTKKTIDLKKAVTVETEVPKFYSNSYHSESYKKIAIADLEVGDILDYFKVFTQKYSGAINLITPVSYSYPVVKQEIIFDVDKLWNFYYSSFNDAPSFKQDKKGGIDVNGRKRKIIKRFILKDANRPAQKDERWDYLYLTEPIFKIMALPPNSYFAGKKRRDNVQSEIDIKKLFASEIASGSDYSKMILSSAKKRLKNIGTKKRSEKKKVNTIYNVIRFEFIKQIKVYLSSSQKNIERVDMGEDAYFAMNSSVFAAMFTSLLEKYDVESEVVQVVPRYFGGVDEVIISSEIIYGVYVSSMDKYFWAVDNYRNPVDNYTEVAGASGYKIARKNLRRRDAKFKKITVPSSVANENISQTTMDIKVNSDNSFDIKSNIAYTGKYKKRYSPLFLNNVPYLEEDEDQLSSEKEKSKKKRAKSRNSYKRRLEDGKEKKEELSAKKRDAIEGWIKGDFELKELKDFEVTSYGRFPEDKSLAIETNFTAEGYLQKAGPNLIFNIGKLITGQIELTDEEIKERIKPVEIDYAHTIENSFTITLPEGYKAQGLETLNINVDNKHAAFIGTASQEGNILTVKTSKIYKS